MCLPAREAKGREWEWISTTRAQYAGNYGIGRTLIFEKLMVSTTLPQMDVRVRLTATNIIGWSIIDIVKNNPKSLTVYFSSKNGRRIRDTYLAIKVEIMHPDGTRSVEPILKDLDPEADSYTFTSPTGLLFSTQFI